MTRSMARLRLLCRPFGRCFGPSGMIHLLLQTGQRVAVISIRCVTRKSRFCHRRRPLFRHPLQRGRLFRLHEYMTLLIVEISPLIHKLEVGIYEFRPSDCTRQLIQLRNGCHAWRCLGFAIRVEVWRFVQEDANSAQRFAVLEIVLDQPRLPRGVAGLFPVLALDDASDARRVGLGPTAA